MGRRRKEVHGLPICILRREPGSLPPRILVEDKLPVRAHEMGAYFMEGLRQIGSPHVKECGARGSSLESSSNRSRDRLEPSAKA